MNFLDILEKYKFYGFLIMMAAVFIYGLAKSDWVYDNIDKLKKYFIKKFTGKIVDKKNKDSESVDKIVNESDITDHAIFSHIDFWINSEIPTMKFSTDYRTAVFRTYLTIYLKNYKDILLTFVQSKKYQKMDKSTLWNNFFQLLNNNIYNYEKEMKEMGIPDIIIDRIKIKNNDLITLTIDITSGICNSNFYDSDKNLLKIYSILNIILSILENSIINSTEALNAINGELKGLNFNGFREPK